MGWTFYNSSGQQLRATADKVATQAEMEAATSSTVFATPARTQYHPGVAKAWGRLSGTDGSSTLDYNMDAATDNGTGDFTLNWTTNFSSVNYSAGGTTSPAIFVGQITDAPAAGTFRIGLYNTSGALADTSIMFLWAFGDQ